jgi:hypothetical protein
VVAELARDDQCQAFTAGFIDDGLDTEFATIMGMTFHKVVGPDMARIFRAQSDT